MLTPKKHIVCVSASYTSGQQLQVSLNKYAQEHDERFSYWEDFAFSTAILPECDSLLILNSPSETILTKCHPANVIAFMMEPGIMHEHPWMFRNLGQFSRVYSPVAGPHTICSHGYLGWYTDKSYPELVALEKPVKTSPASCIVSGLSRLPGHRERLKFSKLLMKSFPSIDFFGRDTCALGDKLDGLLPYKYSIAIETPPVHIILQRRSTTAFLLILFLSIMDVRISGLIFQGTPLFKSISPNRSLH